MKKYLILALLLTCPALSAPSIHSQLQDTNASRDLHFDGYMATSFTNLKAVTNMQCGDQGSVTNVGAPLQKFVYDCSVSQWVPYVLGVPFTPVFTQTNTITPSLTPTYTNTSTYTPTFTFTGTQSYTSTSTPTRTGTVTPTFTLTPTMTPTTTTSNTPGATTPTWTFTQTLTFTPTYTITGSATATPTPTNTYTPTSSYTPTPSYTPTFVYTQTFTATQTNTFTTTFTPQPAAGDTVVLAGKYLGTSQSGAITYTSGLATYDLTAHGFNAGDWVAIENSNQTAYNGLFQIVGVTTNTFTYAVGGPAPTSPSTGTSDVCFWLPANRQTRPWKVSGLTYSGSNVFAGTFGNAQSNAYYGITVSGYDSSGNPIYGGNVNTSTTGFSFSFGDGITAAKTNPTFNFYMRLEGIQ